MFPPELHTFMQAENDCILKLKPFYLDHKFDVAI